MRILPQGLNHGTQSPHYPDQVNVALFFRGGGLDQPAIWECRNYMYIEAFNFVYPGRVGEMRRLLVVTAFMAIPLVAQAQSQSIELVPFPGSQLTPVAITNAPTSGYTLDTRVETIAADSAGAAVINKDIPGLLTDPRYDIFKSMNLKLIASLSGGQMSDLTLAQTKADLAALPTPEPSGQ